MHDSHRNSRQKIDSLFPQKALVIEQTKNVHVDQCKRDSLLKNSYCVRIVTFSQIVYLFIKLNIDRCNQKMAELVRQKKPKHRERPQSDVAPPIPARAVVVNGVRLPEVGKENEKIPFSNGFQVPTHILQQQGERSVSPEPEEQ